MAMKRYTYAAAALVTAALALMPVNAVAVKAAAADDITLTGCLVRGEGEGQPYLLTNAPSEPVFNNGAAGAVAPGGVGTSGEFANVFYWLYGDSEMKEHVGHRVEIKGDLKGEAKPGEIKMDRKDDWTELTVKADGREMKARVPNVSMVPAPGTKGDAKGAVRVRRVDVDHIKMMAASCQ